MAASTDVAIIGMSGLFPCAATLEELHENLARGLDCMREPPRERRIHSRIGPGDYQIGGYLDRIDQFDHAFFRISLRDAERLDPQQRVLLELTCAAIEDAGYSLQELRGSRTAIVAGAGASNYSRLHTDVDATAVTGNLVAAIVGRVCYQLDLRGPAIVVETTCSSGLVAVHQACTALAVGDADYAIAAGITLIIDFFKRSAGVGTMGVVSPEGRSKSFDASADGTGIGEGCGVLLLKPLTKALRDRDVIHAVIRSSAANQDGGRSNGMAAPSPSAQADLIATAWQRAGIDPQTVTSIEAHGTGTKLGDPIEIDGLNQAFARSTDRKRFCAISTIKTNMGHLGYASGLAGVIKAVLSLEHRVLYPSLHFRTPNPLIQFDGGAVYVNTELRPWETGGEARRTGVSSFGVTGTNAHVVLEEAPPRSLEEARPEASARALLVTLSARSPEALRRYARRMLEALARGSRSLLDVAYVLNRGRDDHPIRRAWVVRTTEELVTRLSRLLEEPVRAGVRAADTKRRVVLLLSDGPLEEDPELSLGSGAPAAAFQAALASCAVPQGLGAEATRNIALFRYEVALSAALRALGLTSQKRIGAGVGSIAVSVTLGKQTMAEGVARAAAFAPPAAGFNRDGLKKALDDLLKQDEPVFVEVGPRGDLVRELHALRGDLVVVPAWPAAGGPSLLEALARVYEQGAAIDWEEHYAGEERRRVALPTYPFERVRCWLGEPLTEDELAPRPREEIPAPGAPPTAPRASAVALVGDGVTDTERRLAELWGEILKASSLRRDSDYVGLGGDSLNGMQLLNRIKSVFGAELETLDLFEHATLTAMAARIEEVLAESTGATAVAPAAAAPPRLGPEAPLSSPQGQLYYLYQLDRTSAFYTMPMAFRVTGDLDVGAVKRALSEIVRRHEVLRATYTDEGPTQVVQPARPLEVPLLDLRGGDPAKRDEDLLRAVRDEAARPFDLAKDTSLRARLLQTGDRDHVLVLTLHHIAADGWSLAILFREFTALYRAFAAGEPAGLPEPAAQYAEYARWQRAWLETAEARAELDAWKARLSPLPLAPRLPFAQPRRGGGSFAGVRRSFVLPAELGRAMRELSQREGVTLFMTLLAGFGALLHRYSGQTDMVIGSPVANRRQQRFEGTIGFFSNTLPLRLDLAGDPTFQALLLRVRETSLAAFAHQEIPFDRIVQAVNPERQGATAPLVPVMFVLQNVPVDRVSLPELDVSAIEIDGTTARVDLALSMRETPELLLGTVEYSSEIFEAGAIARLLGHFEALLGSAAARPDTPIGALEYLSEQERRDLLGAWSAPDATSNFDLE
jgi:3-oxoacyl-(acyl-carrier-protein) synthase/aryl carrier-like protein